MTVKIAHVKMDVWLKRFLIPFESVLKSKLYWNPSRQGQKPEKKDTKISTIVLVNS